MSTSQGLNWSAGQYEATAAELQPAAEMVVKLARIKPGQRVLDVATGTGNAALCAARQGATVTGIDTAERLIEVAAQRAEAEALNVCFMVGDSQALPFGDGSFDRVLSVFGLIFAADADLAFSELCRVLARRGRGFISVWVPAGPMDAMVGVFMRAVSEVTGSRPNRFAWSDEAAVTGLAARHGASVRWHDASLAISADSPEAYLATHEQKHPMSLAVRPLLEKAGISDAVRLQALDALRRGNERTGGFLIHSPYRVIEVTSGPDGR